MSQFPSVTETSGARQDTGQALRGLDIDDFLNLFIAELQNQDPLNPMDNSQMLEQISQMRAIGATDGMSKAIEKLMQGQEKEVEALNALTSAIGSVLLGQNLTSATSLIDKEVTAVREDGSELTGVVEKVSVVGGVPSLHIAGETVSLFNVTEVHSVSS
ncbi:MAG: flagellar hook capping FlgD N-terminal domain-containing protein [Pirellulales bacterium]